MPGGVVVELTGGPLSPGEVLAVARDGARVALTEGARAAMAAGRGVVDRLAASDEAHYGVSTGFGSLATRYIEPESRLRLQAALVRSHAAGLGPVVEVDSVRAMMLLRARTLASGRTGARPELAELLAGLLNAGITPVVHEHGSLGCSGDLAPLAHVALALLGEGEVEVDGARLDAATALREAGLPALTLREKEGLALINGTDGMLGMLVLAAADLRGLVRAADVAAAMSVEALLGTDRAFAADLLRLRPQEGQQDSAANLRALLAGSAVVASHRHGDPRVQDAYSLRCHPQVAGAVRDVLAYADAVAARELAAVIDNPVVLEDGRVESNGNFHGAPLAHVADYLAIALADLASISERRTDRLLDATRSHGLPAFLADDPGVDSGLMIAHYTAAALVAECKRLAVPASVDSIPTSAMQEDHVSMGWAAARKLRRAIAEASAVVAVELLAAARGLALRAPLAPAAATAAVQGVVLADGRGAGPDRFVAPELAAVTALVRSGAVVRAAESVTGALR